MPSPLGHALGGLAAGWNASTRQNLRTAVLLAAVGIAPDLDLLVRDHRGFSHSLGAACVAGAIAWIVSRSPRWGLAVAAAWSSHVLLDWLSNDTRPPIGVMALWPLTRDYYKSSVEVFPPVSRRYWESRFWLYNLRAATVEILVLGPAAAIALMASARRKPGNGVRTPWRPDP
jgi:membrane-bound metal-dependent hydrolase YbcI (DUF457 family)